MAMPPQLARGLWLKRHYRRTEQRPLAECLPHINVNDLSIPRDYKTYIAPNISFRYPHISSMRINWNMVQFAHSERIQTFKFKWIKTGFGYPRPTFICECGRPVIKLYFRLYQLELPPLLQRYIRIASLQQKTKASIANQTPPSLSRIQNIHVTA
jgi:hypothetical protein